MFFGDGGNIAKKSPNKPNFPAIRYVHVHVYTCEHVILYGTLCRQLVNSRNRIATGLKKILETNEQVRIYMYIHVNAYL